MGKGEGNDSTRTWNRVLKLRKRAKSGKTTHVVVGTRTRERGIVLEIETGLLKLRKRRKVGTQTSTTHIGVGTRTRERRIVLELETRLLKLRKHAKSGIANFDCQCSSTPSQVVWLDSADQLENTSAEGRVDSIPSKNGGCCCHHLHDCQNRSWESSGSLIHIFIYDAPSKCRDV